MGLDIRSKSGIHFHIGYGGFMYMRNALMESLLPGFGAIHWWAVFSRGSTIPYLAEKGWNGEKGAMEYEISSVTKATPRQFGECCNELLYTWCKANKLTALWDILICHSDCDGKITASQCRRLIKNLDQFSPDDSDTYKNEFLAFRELVRSAANNNETLFFS